MNLKVKSFFVPICGGLDAEEQKGILQFSQSDISMGKSNTIVSAYTMYRLLR